MVLHRFMRARFMRTDLSDIGAALRPAWESLFDVGRCQRRDSTATLKRGQGLSQTRAGPPETGEVNLNHPTVRLLPTHTDFHSKATAHFRRTSLFLGSRLTLYLRSVPPSDVLADELYIARCLHNISRVLATVSAPTETYLEGLIPALLQVTSLDSEISARSATLSTVVLTDHLTKLNQKHMIISFWMAAERAPEAGPIDSIRGATASHLTARTGPDFGYPAVRMSAAEEPVSTGSGWLDNQKALDNSLPALQENYSFDYGDPLMWNFDSLDSEEIFAALLAEGEPDTVMYQ
ncbi:hypothetical protein HRR78_003194 [Exophiala dermatitidis]|nr:hypothetical protein HRR75_000639 [Exophiala dermatitidis]KAJ4552935.1 hypothetical protein HRR78_003194 [Exophiala dermatitidis]